MQRGKGRGRVEARGPLQKSFGKAPGILKPPSSRGQPVSVLGWEPPVGSCSLPESSDGFQNRTAGLLGPDGHGQGGEDPVGGTGLGGVLQAPLAIGLEGEGRGADRSPLTWRDWPVVDSGHVVWWFPAGCSHVGDTQPPGVPTPDSLAERLAQEILNICNVSHKDLCIGSFCDLGGRPEQDVT